MSILILPSIVFLPHYGLERTKEGWVGDSVAQTDVENCGDPALVFVHCNLILNSLPSDGDFKGTVVVMDDGLSVNQWRILESPLYGIDVDIVAYLTPDSDGSVNLIQYDPTVPLSDDQWDDVLCYSPGDGHGMTVISALASIAKKARIIFVNIWFPDDPIGFNDATDPTIWQWLLDNVDTYDIDLISMSYNDPNQPSQQVVDKIAELAQKGVFMVSAIGNAAMNEGNKYPQNHPDVYAVASVDHEDRYYLGKFFQESSKGEYTGSAPYSSWITSYGSSNPSSPEAVDFAMPGNGVPLFSENYQWKYGSGTSFSTPYLAASALIAIYAYNMGFNSVSRYFSDPSPSELYQLLKNSSSSASHSIYNGWGWIYLDTLYENAFQLGKDTASSLGGFF